MRAYRCWTHDLCPPVQGGLPVAGWDGSTPFDLPAVRCDRSEKDCAPGYSACGRPSEALRIAGLWPNGRPSRLFEVDSERRRVETRATKLRAASWCVIRECSAEEVAEAIRELSAPFGPHAERMAAEQIAWRDALARPLRDPAAVEAGLRAALESRRLGGWSLRRYELPRPAWSARDAWSARAVRDARAAWSARDAWSARAVRDARAAWDARDAWSARAAWDARDALSVTYAALSGWTTDRPDLLTIGLRDAYRSGLEIALPTGTDELGWAMLDQDAPDAT
jgi:hypothetical protein